MAAMLPKLFFVHFRDTSFVARTTTGLAGFLCGFRSQTLADEAYIHFVGVDPERRGAGLGARALRAVLRGGRAADDRPRGHVAGERALGRVPPRARLRGRARRRGLRRARRGPRPARQAPETPELDPRFGDAAPSGGARRRLRPWGFPVYRGKFGVPQAERLLWRAGFGPRAGRGGGAREARVSHGAVHSLAQPGRREARRPEAARRQGPPARARSTRGATTTAGGSTGWCARRRPLVERMTLVWHDWFATSNEGVGSQKLMLDQNQLFRSHALGSFEQLLLEVTDGPGDAPLAERHREREGLAERELRARDDGALHARRRPRRVHGARRARAGARR